MYLNLLPIKLEIASPREEYDIYQGLVAEKGENSLPAINQLIYVALSAIRAQLVNPDYFDRDIEGLRFDKQIKVRKIIDDFVKSRRFEAIEECVRNGCSECDGYHSVCDYALMSIKSRINDDIEERLINISIDLINNCYGLNSPQSAELSFNLGYSFYLKERYCLMLDIDKNYSTAEFYAKKSYDIYKFCFGDTSFVSNRSLFLLVNIYNAKFDLDSQKKCIDMMFDSYKKDPLSVDGMSDLIFDFLQGLFLKALSRSSSNRHAHFVKFFESWNLDDLNMSYMNLFILKYYYADSLYHVGKFEKFKKYLKDTELSLGQYELHGINLEHFKSIQDRVRQHLQNIE